MESKTKLSPRPIQARQSNFLIAKKKKSCHVVDVSVPEDDIVKLKYRKKKTWGKNGCCQRTEKNNRKMSLFQTKLIFVNVNKLSVLC